MRFLNTSASEALGYAGFFRLTFIASMFSDQDAALQSVYDAIGSTGHVFPTINYPGATDGVMVVDVRVKTGAESATVGQMATALDRLGSLVDLDTVERVDRKAVSSPDAPADREKRKTDTVQTNDTTSLSEELATFGRRLFIVLLIAGIGFALLEASKFRRVVT